MSSVLHADLSLARRIERAELDFCAVAASHGARVDAIEVAGGRALFSRPGSPLDKVLGVGLHGPVDDADLDRIEAFYRERGAPAQVELCPLAWSDVAARLCSRGFVVRGFENEVARRIGPSAESAGGGVRTTIAGAGELELWLHVVSTGFAAAEAPAGGGPEVPSATAEQLSEVMSSFGHPDIRRYLVWIDGEPAGAGAGWLRDGIVGIFGTATLPTARRRGVQRALTAHILADLGRDADLAIATVAPGSTSQRTFERLGFAVVYTRTIFVKPAPA